MTDKRNAVEQYIYQLMDQVDSSGNNTKRYKELFAGMSNADFDKYMHNLRSGKTQIHVIVPNSNKKINTNTAVALAKKRKVPLFSKIWFNDLTTGRKYLTKYPVLILSLPVRRLSQYLFHKISLPESDSRINPVTGQVIAPDKGATLSNIEIQILAGKGLKSSIVELIKLRGGDVSGYKDLKFTIESEGEANLENIDLTNKPRATITASKYLHGMMIDSNL